MNENIENSNHENEIENSETKSNETSGEDSSTVKNDSQNSGQTPPPYGPQFTNPSQNPHNSYYQNPQPGNNPYTYNPVQQAPKKTLKKRKTGKGIAIAIIAVAVCIALVAAAVKYAKTATKTIREEVTTSQSEERVPADDSEIELVTGKSDDNDKTDSESSGELNAKSVYNKVKNTNVGILTYASNSSTLAGEGSGIVVGENKDKTLTYIVTCAHVISSSNITIKVQMLDGTQYDAKIVGMDKKTDIGLISIAETGLDAATFADSSEVEVGDTVYAIGNPGGTEFFGSFTDGMVSAIGRPVSSPVGYEVLTIQHTAAVNPGNSGGALLNEQGQVIGMNSSKIASTEYEDMAFAVPSATIQSVYRELVKNGYVSGRPALGITYSPASYSYQHAYAVQAYNLPAGTIVISSIAKDSDLANKDVKSGDMIIAFNGKNLDDYNDLLDFINNSKVGDKITLTICRLDSSFQINKYDIEVKLVEDTGDLTSAEEETTQSQFSFWGN
ncbi:MAG: trypsin-like peptidase domain-containing protein [Clostridiales bacterium]|nr:trypsin-like peptidase domain-containing protein [Clostridiales bacterium]